MNNKICIAGKNDIAVNALYYLKEKIGIENLCVIPNKNDSGIDNWQKSLQKAATNLGVTICSLEEIYQIPNLIFISLEFDKIIKTKKFRTTHLYNIHFSKLPKYKGMYTSVMPILNGEKESGVTLHQIDDGIDTGNIIAQKVFPITINDTARDLYFKYLDNAFALFKNNIEKIINGDYKTTIQPYEGASYYSKQSIDFKDIKIDLNKTSFEIHNQIRAFIFKEYQLPQINNFKIQKSILTNEYIGRNISELHKNNLILSGIDGYKIICS